MRGWTCTNMNFHSWVGYPSVFLSDPCSDLASATLKSVPGEGFEPSRP